MDQSTQIFNTLCNDIQQLKQHSAIHNVLITLHSQLQPSNTWNLINKSIQTCIEDIYNIQINLPTDKKTHARSLILNINLLQCKNDVLNILVPALESNQIEKQKANYTDIKMNKLTDSLKNSPYIAGKTKNQKSIETIQSLKESKVQPPEVVDYQYNVLTNSKSGLHVTQGRPWSGNQPSSKLNVKERPSSDYAQHLQRYMQKGQVGDAQIGNVRQNQTQHFQGNDDDFQVDDFQRLDTNQYNIEYESDIRNEDLNNYNNTLNGTQVQQTLQQIQIPAHPPYHNKVQMMSLSSMTHHELDEFNGMKYDIAAEQAEYARLLREKTARKQAISPDSRHNVNQLLSQAPTQGTFTVQKEFKLFDSPSINKSQLNNSVTQSSNQQKELADMFKITEYHQKQIQNNQMCEIIIQEIPDQKQQQDPYGVHRSRQIRNSGIKPFIPENLNQEIQRLQQQASLLSDYMCNDLGYSPQACKSLLEKLYSGVRAWLRMHPDEIDYNQPNGLVNKVLDAQVRMGEVGAIQIKQLVYVMILLVRLGLKVDDIFIAIT